MPAESGGTGVLTDKREATAYRILIEVTERQPAVNQSEIAESVGITSQAVSDYLQRLIEEGYAEKHGRGRYEVTKQGVDWLISRTDELREFTRYVSEEVIDHVETETVLAEEPVEEGERVSLEMHEGVLRATTETGDEGATAVAITSGGEGEALGVADFEGVVDYETGDVTVVPVPPVTEDGSVDEAVIINESESADVLAVTGTESLVTLRGAGFEPDIRFGAPEAVREASMCGLSSVVLTVKGETGAVTDRLRESGLSYEILDATDEG